MIIKRPRFSEQEIVQVREANPIGEVVADRSTLHAVDRDTLGGQCPFHERTGLLAVRPDHGTYHCRECGEGGDVIAFVMKVDQLSFAAAVAQLADRAGVRFTAAT